MLRISQRNSPTSYTDKREAYALWFDLILGQCYCGGAEARGLSAFYAFRASLTLSGDFGRSPKRRTTHQRWEFPKHKD
jgi:hypothetical protein